MIHILFLFFLLLLERCYPECQKVQLWISSIITLRLKITIKHFHNKLRIAQMETIKLKYFNFSIGLIKQVFLKKLTGKYFQ
jgi:hypothetical protein